jgi:putative FmdB family regulatory protein
MPIYAYKCSSCGHAQDVLQKMSDDPLTVCPACHQATFAKQVTAAGFQLKGSGWYVTDFRDGNKKADKKADDKPDGAEAKPAEGGKEAAATPAAETAKTDAKAQPKVDTKADTKTETKPAAPAAPSPTA